MFTNNKKGVIIKAMPFRKAAKEASMNSQKMNTYQMIQRLAVGRTCCFCKKELTVLADFCDPTPVYSPEEEICCQECFHKYVLPARAIYVQKEREIIYNIIVPEDVSDPYQQKESLKNGQVRLLTYQKIVHHTPSKYNISCSGPIPARGKASRSARMGNFSELTCPECRELLLSQNPQLN